MEKINLVEFLKNCPKGMELDCTMFGNVKFIRVEENDKPICIRTGDTFCYLTKFGTWTLDENAKCVIFPKGKTTWEGFIPPCKFKDGDIVTNIEGAVIIYKGITTCGYCGSFVSLDHYNQFIPHYQSYLTDTIRLATEEEKERLFQAIKENGYKWNAETKTLEELVESKFDITTLKPFDKVLIRDNGAQMWSISFFSHCNGLEAFKFSCINGNLGFEQCIPYEGNEHLLGTYDDCDEYYKNWK